MSKADEIFIQNCRDILQNGVWDTDREVRPRWEDGAPAHTVKKFGIVNRYDLSEEFPILTLRRTYWKSAIDELLWIWQQKSNNVHDLRTRVWDAWADENGSIGKAYGYQLGPCLTTLLPTIIGVTSVTTISRNLTPTNRKGNDLR